MYGKQKILKLQGGGGGGGIPVRGGRKMFTFEGIGVNCWEKYGGGRPHIKNSLLSISY